MNALRTSAVALTVLLSPVAFAVPSLFEPVSDGVHVVRDDTGNWVGHMSKDITHQVGPSYQAKKVLDLTNVPHDVWRNTKQVRLSAYFMVCDYSWHDCPPANGLDESFEVVVNGKVHTYPTNCGAPVYVTGKPPTMAWYDFALPKDEFTRGPNEVILRKAEPPAAKKKPDDYLYLGIDMTEKRGNSFVNLDGKAWTQDKLTVPGGNGEYMIRLYLISKETSVKVTWRPGLKPTLEDGAGLIAYSGARAAQPAADGLRLPKGSEARLEWDSHRFDLLEPVKITVVATGDITVRWLDEGGKATEPAKRSSPYTSTLAANRSLKPSGFVIGPGDGDVTLKSVTLEGALDYHPQPSRIDMRPAIAKPRAVPSRRPPSCRIEGNVVRMENSGLRCRFDAGERLRLASLHNEYAAAETVRDPAQVFLFLVEVEGKRYAGSRDFRCRAVTPKPNGFAAELELAEPALRATLSATMDEEGLRLGLIVTNASGRPLDFKLAFPHLAGLAVSNKPEDDYYFFPMGGGIIAEKPTIIRGGYGDHVALYQVMDLFSPGLGAGLYVRTDDAEGRFKTLALRKFVRGKAALSADKTSVTPTSDEFKWTNSLDEVTGTGFAYEYLRRTREPGKPFAPADAVLSAHAGDWRVAMKAYADWAHRVWKFRPYPSRLDTVIQMIAAGWGQGILFKDGAYRTDFIRPRTDCIELMSWWDWSPLGPWSTPFDRLKDVMTEAEIKRWQPYFVKDPVTGQTMWNNQPGDYDGYNERFGGLPAFRKAVQTYKDMGALVTLYTDPFRMDDASKVGQKHGKEWGVVKPDGQHSKGYEVWNPCHDAPQVRQWVAETMRRVMRETGADGIRLDEYGHRGWACFSTLHPHTFAERGCTEWQRATAEATKMVRQAMDEVAPGSVLTTEHPGYDYLMQYLEGCITYDLTGQATPLRPLECNLQRFYFPECQPYELDHRGVDKQHRKRFWNGAPSFGSYYPKSMYAILRENRDAFSSRDCEPLIPTLARYVYANRFSHGEKTLYTLYNATGHTFDGPALAAPLKADEHLFDLLNCQPAQPDVHFYLERDDVACLARLPKRMSVVRKGDAIEVSVLRSTSGWRLTLATVNGEELLSQPVKTGVHAIRLSELPAEAKPACVKLMNGSQMVDVAGLPSEP